MRIHRLVFSAVLALAMLFGPLAESQQAKIPRVGVLSPGNPPPGDPIRQREVFEGGLRDLGWIPGANITIEYRYAEARPDRLPALAAELVRLGVDVRDPPLPPIRRGWESHVLRREHC